jgi:anthranilate synthase/aminodeoxychorismate synthase-like glutamine amidotransferase
VNVLVLDNHDSFTWNLVQAVSALGARVEVLSSDAVSLAEVVDGRFAGLIVSPGPGRPERSGIIVAAVREAPRTMPVLGVCLGHQAAVLAFGGKVVHASEPVHGKTSPILHDGRGIFRGLPSPFRATRYHSLCADVSSLPACLEASAWSDDGVVMGIRHRELPLEGVQFHPESILTEHGDRLLSNFLEGLPRRDDRRVPA